MLLPKRCSENGRNRFFFLSLDQNEIFLILPYNTTSLWWKNDIDFDKYCKAWHWSPNETGKWRRENCWKREELKTTNPTPVVCEPSSDVTWSTSVEPVPLKVPQMPPRAQKKKNLHNKKTAPTHSNVRILYEPHVACPRIFRDNPVGSGLPGRMWWSWKRSGRWASSDGPGPGICSAVSDSLLASGESSKWINAFDCARGSSSERDSKRRGRPTGWLSTDTTGTFPRLVAESVLSGTKHFKLLNDTHKQNKNIQKMSKKMSKKPKKMSKKPKKMSKKPKKCLKNVQDNGRWKRTVRKKSEKCF